MGRSLKLAEASWSDVDNALLREFGGNKSALAKKLKMSRTTIAKFFDREPVAATTFKKICLALRLNSDKVAEKPKADHIKPVQKFDSEIDELVRQVRSRCCEKILQEHSKIRLLPRGEVEVDKVYVDVWVLGRLSADVYTTIPKLLQYFDVRRDRLCLGHQVERRKGLEVVEQFNRLLVLGKPGAGKTTFLKHLVFNCCKEEFYGDLIPLFLELRRIQTDSFDLWQEIHQSFKLGNQSQTETLLQHGRVLMVFDGLDEVPSQWRRQVQNQIRDFAWKYPQNRFVATCRTQTIDYLPENFKSVEVADFNPEQVRQFVENWFSAKTSTQGAEQAQKLLEQLEKNQPIRELAITPILLSLTCRFFDDMGKQLPAQRSQLYRRGLNQLLKEWDQGRDIQRDVGNEVYRKLTASEKEYLLSTIAAQKFEQVGNFVLFDQPEITHYIADHLKLTPEDGEAVLEAIEAQHGLLVERANEIWSFSHLTFQEYFTVYYYIKPQNLSALVSHIFDTRWREVFLLAVEMLQHAECLLKLMKQHIEQSVAQDVKLQQFLNWVQEKAASVSSTYKPAAIRAFYLSLDLARTLDLSLDLARTLDRALSLDLSLDLSRTLDLDLALDLDFDRALSRARALDLDLARALVRARDDLEFQRKLQDLRDKLQGGISNNLEQWWQVNGTTWTNQLRAAVIEHRNIGHDWQFSEAQKQLLKRYYDANKLLVDCLKISYPDGHHPVRQEIESTLLLPISAREQP